MIRTAPRSWTENREMPMQKVGTILYTTATSYCVACGYIVFSVKTLQSATVQKAYENLLLSGGMGLVGLSATEDQL